MSKIMMIALGAASLGFILVIFKLLKKGGKLAAKLPTNFLIIFLIYAILGLTGFMSKDLIAQHPVALGILLLIVSLSAGIVFTDKLYGKWEWSTASGFGKKLLYLIGIAFTGIAAFIIVFLLCEHRGFPRGNLGQDLVWWLAGLIFMIPLPLLIKNLHFLWNDIPKLLQVRPIFQLPLGSSPPFFETGGATVNFRLVIPLDYNSDEKIKTKISVPVNKTLAEAYHYVVHEHNIVKRYAKKIVLAENNKLAKVYGWSFFRPQKKWWGWFVKKNYIDPKLKVRTIISNQETIFVERVKIWEQ